MPWDFKKIIKTARVGIAVMQGVSDVVSEEDPEKVRAASKRAARQVYAELIDQCSVLKGKQRCKLEEGHVGVCIFP